MWHHCTNAIWPAFIPAALEMFLQWISNVAEVVNRYYNLVHYPVLVAHNGFTFDFLILLAELHRRNMLFNCLCSINLHFADTYFECKRLVMNNFAAFANWTPREQKCLGVTNLYSKLFPDSTYNAHRALEMFVQCRRFLPSYCLIRVDY